MIEGILGVVPGWRWSGLRRSYGSRCRSSEECERVEFLLAAELAGSVMVAGESCFGADLSGSDARRTGGSHAQGLRNDETEQQQGLKETAGHYSPIVA